MFTYTYMYIYIYICIPIYMTVPMHGAEQQIHHSKAKMLAQQSISTGQKRSRMQQLDLEQPPKEWSDAVQLGNKDHAWHTYVADESVMGKPYEDKPFGASINSVLQHNTARE